MNIILWDKGAERGPYEPEALIGAIESGEISGKILARLESGTDWKPLELLLSNRTPKAEQIASQNAVAYPSFSRRNLIRLMAVVVVIAAAFGSTWGWKHFAAKKIRDERRDRIAPIADALAELKKIESALAAGVTFPEYSRRVLDCKVSMDAILSKVPATDELRVHLEASLRAFLAARDLWDALNEENGFAVDSKLREKYAEYPKLFGNHFALPDRKAPGSEYLDRGDEKILWREYALPPLSLVKASIESENQ